MIEPTPELIQRLIATIQAAKAQPSLPRKISNAGKAIIKAASGKLKGVPLLCPPEVAEARAAICQTCEFVSADKTACTHPKCGCKLSRGLLGGVVPGKTQVATQACPIGKWQAWQQAPE